MPPANSRAASPPEDSPVHSETSQAYLSALRELENPVSSSVLNLASTLTTSTSTAAGPASASPEDDVAAENLRFLRTPMDPQEEWRAENAQERFRERLRRTAEQRSEDRERRERLQRVLNRLSRIHEPPSAYGDRIPTQNTLYDWSPSNNGASTNSAGGGSGAGANMDEEDDLEAIIEELRQQRPHTHPDILRHEAQLRLERSRAYLSRSNLSTQPSESSLRSAAILQSVRRHPRFSARSREFLQRYIADRDSAAREAQSSNASEGRDRPSPSRTTPSSLPGLRESGTSGRYDQNRRSWLAEQNHMGFLDRTRTPDERDYWRSRIDSYRRTYLENPSSVPPTPSPWLETTIRYLSRLRSAACYDDALSFALDAGFVTKEFFGENHEDFLLDPSTLPPTAETSWLRPGAVLSGSQHATTVTSTTTTGGGSAAPSPGASTTLYRFRNSESTGDSSRPWVRDTYVPPHARRAGAMDSYSTHTPSQDRWPVKVAIHTVDYEKMSLTATMEAYNVPSQPSTHTSLSTNTSSNPYSFQPSPSPSPTFPPHASSHAGTNWVSTRTSSITTYLEGEILDFRTHTFLTESFKSDALNDASYWRMLPPFSSCNDEELVRNLVSRKWLSEKLCNEYVLMRWKERCFVRDGRHNTNRSPGGSGTGGPNGNGSGTTPRRWSVQGGVSAARDTEEEIAEDGCGLTISGFYYVCLRRSDGRVEGLYCDPQSSPYQHLKLKSVGGGVFPVWEFR